MQNNNNINWGIIGLGSIAHKFATDLNTIQHTKLHAVASRDQNKADTFAKTHNATVAYGSYDALIKDKTIDIVYIATPHALHFENTMACLEQGIAVLCEKPFAMNSEQVQQMIATAKRKNTLLMEALWTYFLPHYQYVLNTLKNNIYGRLEKIEADFGFNRPFEDTHRLFNKSLGGGSLLDIGIYPIFVALSVLGEPENIEANATYFKNGADASCDMVFSYKNNTKALLKSALNEDTPTEAIFYCEHGIIKINTMFHAPSTVTLIPKDETSKTIDFNYNTIGYNYEAEHMNALFRSGKTESNVMTFAFSTQLITLLDKVRQLINLEY